MIDGLDITDPILSLDLSTACVGWCVLRGPKHRTGHKRWKGELPEKLALFRPWLRHAVEQIRPAVILIEAPIVGPGADTLPLAKMHGVAAEALAAYTGLGPLDIHASTWKSQILGTNRITSKQKREGLIVRALVRMGFNVDHIDEADALAIALCFRKQNFGSLTC